MGGVRPLVTMMATNSESKHYASLALLKLSDNFENHATIAEEGGIQVRDLKTPRYFLHVIQVVQVV